MFLKPEPNGRDSERQKRIPLYEQDQQFHLEMQQVVQARWWCSVQ